MIKYFTPISSDRNIFQRACIFITTCCIFISCNTGHNNTGSPDPDIITVNTDSISFKSDTTALTLKSYGINSYLDDNETIFGYNYKTHSIDVFSIAEKSFLNTIPLDNQGPEAVQMSIRYIKAYSPDSIAVYDDNAICLLDSTGKVLNKFNIPYNGMTRIDCNTRGNMSAFDIDFKNNRIIYPIKEDGNKTIVVYDFKNNSVVRKINLKDPTDNGKHGFMNFPNLNINAGKIVYNYPYEHKIHVLDMTTGNTREVEYKCPYLAKGMDVLSDESPDGLTWYGIENFFYSPLYYLEGKKCYVRFALGGSTVDRSEGFDKAMYSRPMFISVFNEQFEPIGEVALKRNLYDPFGGWFVMSDRFCLFRDNVFDESGSENTIIDMLDLSPVDSVGCAP